MNAHYIAAVPSQTATMRDHTISVVIPTYNSAHLLERAIASVLRQTHPVSEILVIDDGSTDNTAAVLARYGETVRALHQANAGSASARNRGILAATGFWIAFLDADDQWLPEKIARQLAFAWQRPEASLIYTDAFVVGESGEITGRCHEGRVAADGWAFDRLLTSFFALPSATLVRRQLMLDAGLFSRTLRYAEDLDLWLRLARLTPFAFLPEPLMLYERQPTSLTRNDLAYHQAHIKIFTQLLQQELTTEQHRLVQKRIRSSRQKMAWEWRKTDPRAALHASWQYLADFPEDPTAWKLTAASLAACLRAASRRPVGA